MLEPYLVACVHTSVAIYHALVKSASTWKAGYLHVSKGVCGMCMP